MRNTQPHFSQSSVIANAPTSFSVVTDNRNQESLASRSLQVHDAYLGLNGHRSSLNYIGEVSRADQSNQYQLHDSSYNHAYVGETYRSNAEDEVGYDSNGINHGDCDDEPQVHDSDDAGDEDFPDGEPIKIFVGQVPKNIEEDALVPIFSQFGPLHKVAIIRDRHTGQHRGCAFVTFLHKEDAEACEAAFHDKFILPDGKRPVQIRPASGQKDIENKIFVGMLPRDIQESNVRDIFEQFGEVLGVFLIRRTDEMKKGCAFVKFATRDSALAAIESVNNVTLEGSDRPLIVKFADARNPKRAKSQQGRHLAPPPSLQLHSITESVLSHGSQPPSPIGSPFFIPSNGPPLHIFTGQVTPPSIALSTSSQYTAIGQYPSSYASSHGSLTPPLLTSYVYPYSNPYAQNPAYHPHTQAAAPVNYPKQKFSGSIGNPDRAMNVPKVDSDSARPVEGPAGANLFIYHLPHDLTDADLATLFNSFGNVLSAKVFMDKFTGESKGFGFVSYDSVISAEHAIEQMNGFQIGNKRLKVQHKRVHHRPPLSMPTIHGYYQSSCNPPVAIHDMPPSVEYFTVSHNTAVRDSDINGQMDILTRSLGSLSTSRP